MRSSNFVIILHGSNYSVIKFAFQCENIIRVCNSGTAECGVSQREHCEGTALTTASANAEVLQVENVKVELQHSSPFCGLQTLSAFC